MASGNWLTPADNVAARWGDFLLLVGRVLIGWIFIRYGWEQIVDIPRFADVSFEKRGVPGFLAYIAAPVDLLGGVALVLGLGTRYVAPIMVGFTIVATAISHRYWEAPAAQLRTQEQHFWRNFALMGGLIILFVHGAGRLALDCMFARKA